MSNVIWNEFTASVEKQVEANERLIAELAQDPAGVDTQQSLIDRLMANSAQLRGIAARARAKAVH